MSPQFYCCLYYSVSKLHSHSNSSKLLGNILQVNEKGQLRLSRRALLPESSTKPQSGNTIKGTTDSQKAYEKGKPKETSSGPKNDAEVANGKIPEDRSLSVEEETNTLVEDKFVKKLVNSGKDVMQNDKTRPKKSSSKSFINVSRKSEGAVVNGEANS